MGVPVIGCGCETCQSSDAHDKRLRTSLMLSYGGHNVVFDSGPDFRQQMLRENVKTLTALVFTHEHKDHTAGMDDVRAFNFVENKPVTIFATQMVEAALRHDYHYAFTETKYPGVPDIRFERIENQPFSIAGIEYIPVSVMHHKLPVLGFRMADFTYITDANFITEEEKKKIRGTRFLVLNALRKTSHISHFTLDEALALIEELQPEKAFLTHISHQMGRHETASRELPPNVVFAYDGMKVEWESEQ